MSDMRIMGSYSGIDMSTVEQLISAEASKGVKFTQKKEQYTQSKNAWKDLNTRLDSLYKRLDDLQKSDTYVSKSVKLSNTTNISVSAKTTATPAEYRVQVQQLATQTRLTGTKVTSVDSIHEELPNIVNGDLILNNGEKDFKVSIETGDSLSSISEKINDQSKDSGVRSSIVDNRLILTHTEYGDEKIIIVEDSILAQELKLSGADVDTVPGNNAKFKIDGLLIEKSTNTIDDVIEGVTFNLSNIHEGADATIVTVSEDMNKAADTLQKFVDQYNSTQTYIKSQLDVGDPSADDNKTGTLSGDGTLMRLQSNLRMMMTKALPKKTPTDDSIKGLTDLGIEIGRDGTATFDRKILEEKIKSDPQGVSNFFSKTEKISETTTDKDGLEVTTTKDVKKGFAVDMRSFVDGYISSSSGIIKTRNDTFDRMIKDVDNRISQFEDRLESKKARYIKQFTALDTAMMMAESQLEQMYSQLGMGQD